MRRQDCAKPSIDPPGRLPRNSVANSDGQYRMRYKEKAQTCGSMRERNNHRRDHPAQQRDQYRAAGKSGEPKPEFVLPSARNFLQHSHILKFDSNRGLESGELNEATGCVHRIASPSGSGLTEFTGRKSPTFPNANVAAHP